MAEDQQKASWDVLIINNNEGPELGPLALQLNPGGIGVDT